ncbi:MAG: hypothetical protein DCC65_15445 [Planctomycetota bacterium]|nr:MAG: hypothetical protein DCC65_15445 [Planctomycetota bacterium]
MHRPPTATLVSDEPVILAIHRRALDLLPAVLTLGLVYTCLVPFDFRGLPDSAGGPGWRLGLRSDALNAPDILANITIYIPLGASVCGVARRRTKGRLRAMIAAVFYGALLSAGIEYAQNFVHSRVGSWADVCANVAGSGIGAGLVLAFEPWLRIAARHAVADARRNWRLAVCKGFIALVLVAQLRPYDVVVDVTQTAAAAWRSADFHPLARYREMGEKLAASRSTGDVAAQTELQRERMEYALDRGVDAMLFAAIAALVILGLAEERRRRIVTVLSAGGVSLLIAGMIVFVRIFLMSHGFDAATAWCAVAGWPVGAVAAFLIERRENRAAAGRAGPPDRLPAALAAGCVFMVALFELVPFDFDPAAAPSPGRVCLFPFRAHFGSDANIALADISGDFVRYGILGAAIAVLLEGCARWPWRLQLVTTSLASMLAAALAETLHLYMPSRASDITTILLAGAASTLAGIAVRWVRDLRASLRVVEVDDLLTRQLIEGDTYKPLVTGPADRPRAGASRTGRAESDLRP